MQDGSVFEGFLNSSMRQSGEARRYFRSLKHTFITFSYEVDNAKGFKKDVITTNTFLGPWGTYHDDYLLNPDLNREPHSTAVEIKESLLHPTTRW